MNQFEGSQGTFGRSGMFRNSHGFRLCLATCLFELMAAARRRASAPGIQCTQVNLTDTVARDGKLTPSALTLPPKGLHVVWAVKD